MRMENNIRILLELFEQDFLWLECRVDIKIQKPPHFHKDSTPYRLYYQQQKDVVVGRAMSVFFLGLLSTDLAGNSDEI